MTVLRILATSLIALAGLPAFAQQVTALPDKTAPLHEQIQASEALLHGNHWNEGLYMNHVIFPPAGEQAPVTGNHEDVAGHTAVYLAGCAHRYAVTHDPAVRDLADEVMAAIVNLEKVTGVTGVAARSFYRTDKPLWHEQAFFFPMEWHASTSMPGYRWEGDLSSDKFTDFIYGVGTYWEFCADDAHKQIAADFLDRFVGRCVDYNFKLVDVDNKMTLWGNFCPDLPHENLNALEMLAGLKVAYHVTGKDRYRAAYRRLIDTYHYDEQAILAKVLWPEKWKTPWDDHLAAKALYMVMRYETDPGLLEKYRMCLNRHWYDWKQRDLKKLEDQWYVMLYQVLTGEPVVDERVNAALRGMWGVRRGTSEYTLPAPGGPKTVQSEHEEISSALFRNYWFGRQYGLIVPEW